MIERQIFIGGFNSGKTTKLTEIYLDLIKNKQKVLFISSNEDEILPKVLDQVDGFDELWIDNFSSFAKKILRKYFSKNFKVISGFEQKLIIEKLFSELNASEVVDFIDETKLKMQTNEICEIYQKELNNNNFFDHKDLILKATEVCIEKFDYVLIDDLEEITNLELHLLNKIANKNIFAAMNPHGSIFKFRGADPKQYAKQFIETKVLEQKALCHSEQREESLFFNFTHEPQEVEWIARQIRELMLTGNYQFSDFVVLRRSLKESARLYREIFTRLNVPFNLQGMGGVFDDPEVLKIVREIKEKEPTDEFVIDFLTSKISFENPKINKFIEIVEEYAEIRKKIYDEELTIKLFHKYLDDFLKIYTFETSIREKNINSVEITTIQNFKGKHKKIVFLAGVGEGVFPKDFGKEKEKMNFGFDDFFEQEQNLFNLATSRAMEQTFITNSVNEPSDFVANLQHNVSTEKIQTREEFELVEIFHKLKTFEFPTKHTEKINIQELHKILKNFNYSASSVKDYTKCNFLFLLGRVARISVLTDTIALDFGSICHKILEEFYKKIFDYTELNSINSTIYLEELIDRVFEEKKDKFQGFGELRWYKNRATKFLFDYLEELREDADFVQILSLEKKFEAKLNDINIVGRIDRIDEISDENIEIIDYKTGANFIAKGETIRKKIENGEEFQMLFYYLLVNDEKLTKLSYIWLEKETRGGKKATLIPDRELMEIGKTNLINLIKKIQSETFEFKTFGTCRNCRFEFICK